MSFWKARGKCTNLSFVGKYAYESQYLLRRVHLEEYFSICSAHDESTVAPS